MKKIYSVILLFLTYSTTVFCQSGYYSCDFEDVHENARWQFIYPPNNENARWIAGQGINNGGTGSLHLNGNYYCSPIIAYRELYISAGPLKLSLDVKCEGWGVGCHCRIFMIPSDQEIDISNIINPNLGFKLNFPIGTIIVFDEMISNYNLWSNVSFSDILVPNSQTYKICFLWINNNNGWGISFIPPAIDNIIIRSTPSPFWEDFEDDENDFFWEVKNDHEGSSDCNKWNIGGSVSCVGQRSLYISNNNGSTNSYISCWNNSFACRTIYLPEGEFQVNYDWKASGSYNNGILTGNYIRALLLPFDPNAYYNTQLWGYSYNDIGNGITPSNAISLDNSYALYGSSSWTHYTDTFYLANSGFYKLIFYAHSYINGIGATSAAAVDNISISNGTSNLVNLNILSNNSNYDNISGSGVYNYLDTANVKVNVSNHYHITEWSNALLPFYISPSKDSLSIVMDNDYNLSFNVAIDTHSVYVNKRGGTSDMLPSVSNNGNIPYLENCTVTATTSNPNWRFRAWSNGETINPYSFVVTQDTCLTAIYLAPNETAYRLQTICSIPDAGLIGIGGAQQIFGDFYQGGSILISATPNYGYHFVMWNDGDTNRIRIITLNKDTSFTAFFVPNYYTLQLHSGNDAMGSVSGSGIYLYQEDVTVSATPAPHCHFVQWSDGNTSNPRIVTVTQNASYTAYFSPDPQYIISVKANDTTMGTAEGGGLFYVGEQTILTAFAKNHYHFQSWDDGINDNPRTITVIDNSDYTALFAPINHIVNITSSDEYMGSVYGGGIYPYGSVVSIAAQPYDGYHFISWSDGDCNSYREIYVDGDINLQARFGYGSEAGIDLVTGQPMIITKSNDIIISNAEGLSIYLYDILGRIVSTINKASSRQVFSVTTEGIYIVSIEGYKPQKCLVR